MIFSKLTSAFDQPLNRLYEERQRLLAQKVPLLDLVSGNVSDEGIQFPRARLARSLAAGQDVLRTYRPNPLGQPAARTAIARYYKKEGHAIDPEHMILTPGTSLAYAYLFQALADPGDEILCPQPNYPLFGMIAETTHVRLTHYALRPGTRWAIDFDSLEAAVTPRTRAVVLISPHNPTGAVATDAELKTLAEWAARRQLPIIADEVFSPFLFQSTRLPRPMATKAPLVLTLNGFSKMLALPGLKLGWIAVTGDPTLVRRTLAALEMISDTYLPVNEGVQSAVASLLHGATDFLKSYPREVQRRVANAIVRIGKMSSVRMIPPEGGFYAVLELRGQDEESICWELLTKHHTVIHPGFFYDLEGSHLILSTVHRPSALRRGLQALEKVL